MNQAAEKLDLLIEARWIIPIQPAELTLEHHAVAIRGGRIVDILPIAEARQRYNAASTTSLPEHVLIPGLINLHAHTAMSLLRGYADDMPLMDWLQDAIWPAEKQHVSDSFVFDGTLLGAAEMLRSGITCVNDMYFHPDASARAYDQLGMRAVVGITVLDFPTGYAADAEDYIRKGLEARDQWRDHARIKFALAPHAPYSLGNTSLERVSSLAEELDALVHIHLQETAGEVQQSLAEHGIRPLERLRSLGLLGPNLLAAHAVHVTDAEIAVMAEHNVRVIHNPVSNMKLASGAAPVARMLSAGVCVGLGTDGAASNNRLDILQEMRMAALLAKVSSGDASALSTHQALRMATLNGAIALGMQDEIGSIENGKKADLTAIRMDSLETTPVFNPASHLTYVVGREHVDHVWIDGKAMISGGEMLHDDNVDLLRNSRLWQSTVGQ